MEKQDYTATIVVNASTERVFNCINNVSEWWTENLEGSSSKLGDEFKVLFGGDTFVTHKLVEVISEKKVIWLVTDCNLSWLKDKNEWTNTKIDLFGN